MGNNQTSSSTNKHHHLKTSNSTPNLKNSDLYTSNSLTNINQNNGKNYLLTTNRKLKANKKLRSLSHIFDLLKGYSTVELHRINGSQFGLTIAGGSDKESKARICDLKPGSIAHRSDELQVGDLILAINGIKTIGLKHEEIIDLIKTSGDLLRLDYEYNLPPWPIHPPNSVRSQTVHIQLEKEGNSYGFTMRGGSHDEKSKARPLIVTNIRAGGSADREGTLKIGDRILAINGINLFNATLHEAYCIMKQCKGLALFLVEYDSAIVDSIKNSNGPLLIEIEKSPGSSIGIKLNQVKNSNSKNQIIVESVKPASIADRCGAIFVGDQILSIDDTSFEHVTLAEANQILKNCVGEFSRVEILPLSQINNVNGNIVPAINNNTNGSISSSRPSSSYKSTYKSLSELNREYRLVDMQQSGSINSCGTLLNANHQVCHQETVEVGLKADDTGTFGFTLQGGPIVLPNSHMVDNISNNSLYPVIGYVEPNSSAEKSGLMQPSDRIISINGRSLENLTIDEARQIIKESGSKLVLEIEFDVADAIMLTSGVFQVKLLRKNLDLGVSVTYPRFTKPDDYPYIYEVKKGSVAYRSGMLQPGDRLMFIDQYSLKGKSIADINQLIRNSDEVVKLKIKKDDNCTEDNTDDKVIVYTVELQRNGGPLGITISGSDERFEPMYVSGLTDGGLADRTNAIHVGDVILAINNVTLRGKTLSEAIELLQNADNMVTLKISRNLNNEHTVSTPQPQQRIIASNSSNQLSTMDSFKKPTKSIDSSSSQIYIPQQQQQQPPQQSKLQSASFTENNINNNVNGRLKKGTSLDSINAVERELDEVLKDLEMNSSDLNIVSEQMNNASLIQQNVHLPITIHQSHNKQQAQQSTIPALSSSSFINSSNNNRLINSEFLSNGGPQSTSNININNSNNNNSNHHSDLNNNSIRLNRELSISSDPKRRQNIISTYEICQECFDVNNTNTGCSQHPQSRVIKQQSSSKPSTSDFTPILSNLTENQILNPSNKKETSTLNTTIPLKITLSSSSFTSPNDGIKQTNGLSSSSSTLTTTNGKPPIAVRLNKSNSVLVNSNGNSNNKTILHQSPTPRQGTVQKSVTISEKSSPISKFNGSRTRSTSSHYNEEISNGNKLPAPSWSPQQINGQNSALSSLRKQFPNYKQNESTFTNNNNNNNSSSSNETLCKYNNGDFELSINEPFDSSNNNNRHQLINNNHRNYDNVINYPTDDDKCEKIEIIVNKDYRYNDYGFSIADSLFGKGVFVNKVRTSNQYPYLQPYTQIFKISNIDTTNLECSQVYKILANESHNDKLKLLISKKPRKMKLEYNESISFDEQNNNKASVNNNNNNNNGVYIAGSCKTTAL